VSIARRLRLAAILPACLLIAAVAAPLAPAGDARAQPACMPDRFGNPACPPAGAQCTADRYGNPVCSPADGGVAATRTGEILCGRGACVADLHGEVRCSTVPRGAATLDRYGKAVCSEGCEPGSPALCVRPK
jgi:hypothetical protein